VDAQKQMLDQLRSRAGTLLAAAALVTTFLGGQALAGGRNAGLWGGIAIATFIAVAICTVIVLLPWRFHFFFDPSSLVENYVDDEPQPSAATVMRDLALHHDLSRLKNDELIGRLIWAFRGASIFLGAEVGAWLLELGQRTH
jgi:hypothetical protein